MATDRDEQTRNSTTMEQHPSLVFRTVVFADVASSSALAEACELEAFNTIGHTLRMLRREARLTGGRVVNEAGDGALVEFPVVGSAVRWARRCHLALSQGAVPCSHGELKLRIGIHAGTVLMFRRRLFGCVVHTACRLQQAAAPGETLISATACESSAGLDFPVHRPRCVPIKGTGRSVQAYAVDFLGGRAPPAHIADLVWTPENLLPVSQS